MCSARRQARLGGLFFLGLASGHHGHLQRAPLTGNLGQGGFDQIAIARLDQLAGKRRAHAQHRRAITPGYELCIAQPGIILGALELPPQPLLRGAPHMCVCAAHLYPTQLIKNDIPLPAHTTA
jgi:hypothetical protein